MIELLVVISMMAFLASPSLVNLAAQSGRNFTREIYDMQAAVALIRTSAVTKNTFVWVGLSEIEVNKQKTLVVVAYQSLNGLNDTTPSNLAPVMKRQVFPGLGLMASSRLLSKQETGGTDLLSAGSAWALPEQRIGTTAVPITQTILFSPTGEAFLSADPLSYIEIGLQPRRGNSGDDKDIAVLQISGITGQADVLRN